MLAYVWARGSSRQIHVENMPYNFMFWPLQKIVMHIKFPFKDIIFPILCKSGTASVVTEIPMRNCIVVLFTEVQARI